MATEKRLIPFGEKVTLYDLPFGAIFAFGDDCIAVKSEYTCGNGLIESFILGSGEQFWGGAKTAKEQNELMVQPLEIVDVDAVEVVHGRWEWFADRCEDLFLGCDDDYGWRCSHCKTPLEDCDDPEVPPTYNYCPNCGAKMDGGNEYV